MAFYHRMLDNRMQCMPGDEVWLMGERRSDWRAKIYGENAQLMRASRCSLPRSALRQMGLVTRRISNSRRSYSATTSKVDPGLGYTDTP